MIRTARCVPALCAAFVLAACAAVRGGGSYVAPLSAPADVQTLATGMTKLVAMELPAAASTIALAPMPAGQAGNALTAAFAADLRHDGFAIADAKEAAGAHRIRYQVTPIDGGDAVRITIDGRTEDSRYFVRNSAGGLQIGGPITVRRIAAAR